MRILFVKKPGGKSIEKRKKVIDCYGQLIVMLEHEYDCVCKRNAV